MVVFFPEDVIIDILLRLPSKSLGRSRCVSKYWNTLITSPSFFKAHLHRSSKLCHLICQESKHTELMMHHISQGGGYHLWSEEDDEEELSVSKLKMRFSRCCEISNLNPHPAITDGFNNFKLVDSFNGIVCLYAVNEKISTSRIWLWNPAINDCFIIPEPQFPISSADVYCVGFGFNPLTRHLGDYKVVIITLYYEDEGDCENCSSSRAEIYSRRTNSWKELVGWFPDSCVIGSDQVIFEEYICWCYYERRWSGDQYKLAESIVSFNLVSEEFHSIALPDSIPSDYKGYITLLEGCVSLLVPTSDFYEVWTMKEFGNIESLSKLYNLNFQTSNHFGRTITIPLGFASTDEALFLRYSYGVLHASNKVIYSYDTRTMTIDESKTVSFDHAVTDCCLKLYVESLIPVSCISRLDEGQSSDE